MLLNFLRSVGATAARDTWPTRLGAAFSIEATDARVEQFTESVSFDRRLYAHDIAGSIAHAQMLAKVGLIYRRRMPAD